MSSASYLIEHWRDEASRLEAQIERLEAQAEDAKEEIENLRTENEGLKEANEELEHMLHSEIYCRQARVRRGLGAGDRR